MLLKRKMRKNGPRGYCVGYRRCRAGVEGGDNEDCILLRCREFLDVVNGVYLESFDTILPLLLTCRDL